MIRLYPKVLKSEENIQDLRRVLSDLQQENCNQCNQLTDSGRRIQDIGAELREAESVRSQRATDSKNIRQAAKGLAERVQGQQEASVDLKKLLARSQAGHERQLENLAMSEHENKTCWDEFIEQEAQMAAVTRDLAAQLEIQAQCQETLSETMEGEQHLAKCYRGVEDAAIERRIEIREAGIQTSEHTQGAGSHEAEEEQLKKSLDSMQDQQVSLSKRLSTLDTALPESEGLKQAVEESNTELENLKEQFARLETELAERRKTVESSETQTQGLLQRAHDDDVALADLSMKTGFAEEAKGEMGADLARVQREYQELQKKQATCKEEAEELEIELSGRITTNRGILKELEAVAVEVETDFAARKKELEDGEAEADELLRLIDKHQQERDELQEKHKELEREYDLRKEKCKCVIS